ncbi:MAG: hypothetical protein LQ337_008640 [Flavoplaca oasis]|nr:MAG: hypothetical protein LQ337_008640 [Flavoplaca oasis]
MLHINVHPGPYTPGSPISGTVSLEGDGLRSLKVQTIKITFRGRSKSNITESSSNNNRTHHRARITLFHYEQVLLTGPYSMNPSHQWPFDFKFPECCHSTGPRQFKNSSKSFNEDIHQPLPGSFAYSTANFLKANVEASVRYELEAALVAPEGSRGSMERTRPLTLIHQRHQLDPDPRLSFSSRDCQVQSLYLSPEYQHRAPTFKEKFKSGVSWGKSPEAHYILKILLPTVAVIGRPMPLFLGVTYDEDRSTTESAPTVLLRNVKVQLVARTTVRCASASMWSSNDVHDSDYNTHTLGEKDFIDQNIELTDRFNVAELMNLIMGERQALLVPSFKTFNIIRTYTLRVHITTECGRKKSHHIFTTSELVIMARDYCPPPVFPFVIQAGEAEADITAVPPSYEAVVNK